MSATLDANVLLYASDSSSPFAPQARALLETIATERALVYVFWPVAMAYLRIATHPGVFDEPLAPAEAMRNVERLLALPNVRAPGEAEGFWSAYRSVVESQPIRGNLVPDAHLVALMRQYDVDVVWTRDYDFRRFAGIRVQDPFAGATLRSSESS